MKTQIRSGRDKWKSRVFEIIQIGYKNDFISRAFDYVISALIFVNIAITIALTFDQVAGVKDLLGGIELATIIIFLVEYLLRIWTAEYLYLGKMRFAAILRFMVSFYGVVDFFTIIPYFLPLFFPTGLAAFRLFRVVRIFRLFRINANYDAFNVITEVLKEKSSQLLSSLSLILMLLVASSLCMYSLEHEAQPENFSNAFSGIWWSVSTLLTVGYGDIYPVTAGGRLMAIVIAFLGVGVVAIPTGIISAGFMEYFTRLKQGTYTQHEASFATIKMEKGHPYVGKCVEELSVPEGMYPAAVLRGEDVYMPGPDLYILEGDRLVFGTTGDSRVECLMEEIWLESGHPWIGSKIKHLDISRRDFVVMVRRDNLNIRPKEDMILKAGDKVLLLENTKNV